MSDAKFQGTYEVDDGYVSGGRPLHFKVFTGDLESLPDDPSDDDIVSLYEDLAREAFEEHVSQSVRRVDEFVAWARERISEAKEG